MRYRRLFPGGPEVSELALGASPLGGIYFTFAERDGIAAVRAALSAVINTLDVTPHFGMTAAETVLARPCVALLGPGYVLATAAESLTRLNGSLDVRRPDWWSARYPPECGNGHPWAHGRMTVSGLPCTCAGCLGHLRVSHRGGRLAAQHQLFGKVTSRTRHNQA